VLPNHLRDCTTEFGLLRSEQHDALDVALDEVVIVILLKDLSSRMTKSKTNRGCAAQITGLTPKFKFRNPEKFCAFSDRGRSFDIPVYCGFPEDEKQAEAHYRALCHWDALVENKLWGPVLEKDSNYDPRAAPPSGRSGGGVYYGVSGATLDSLRYWEIDDRDPYANILGTQLLISYRERVWLYSLSQSEVQV
jgi:hypothetical protein